MSLNGHSKPAVLQGNGQMIPSARERKLTNGQSVQCEQCEQTILPTHDLPNTPVTFTLGKLDAGMAS
jgi:hypothetical protein